MSKHYFYSNGKDKIGPLTLDELKEVRLTDDTLIWREDFKDWLKAKDVEDLNNFIIKAPPSLPSEKKKEEVKTFLSISFRKGLEIGAIISGIYLIFMLAFLTKENFAIYLTKVEKENFTLSLIKIWGYGLPIYFAIGFIISSFIFWLKENSSKNNNNGIQRNFKTVEPLPNENFTDYKTIKTRKISFLYFYIILSILLITGTFYDIILKFIFQ
jgi:hypothetical protein